MALIKCPECGKEVSDKAPACPNCGCPIQTVELPKSVDPKTPEEKPKKKTKVAIAVITAIAVLGALCGAYFMFFSPGAKLRATYSKATELYNAGNYAEALPIYEDLGEYSNSADAAVWCRYCLANEAISKEQYEAAKEYLYGINYENSEELTKSCYYQLGIQAMDAHDWASAAALFDGLYYEKSEKMLTDCSFMIAIMESITRRMDMTAKESNDYKTLVTTELAYLEDYRKADFYDQKLKQLARKYINGLDTQKNALNYEYYYEYQRDWNTGLVARYEVLDKLYRNYGLLKDNNDFIGTYINQLSYYKNWLRAFTDLEENGHISVKDPKCTRTYVEYYFKNNTKYRSSQVFNITFWSYDEKTLFSTVTTTVENIQPYQEFTVRVYVPTIAQQDGYTCNWDNYYETIYVD